MSTESFLLEKYGPLLSLGQLANLLDRSTDGLRLSLRQDGDLSEKFAPAMHILGHREHPFWVNVNGDSDGT